MFPLLRLTSCLVISLFLLTSPAWCVEPGVESGVSKATRQQSPPTAASPQSPGKHEQLDVDILVFDPGIPADASTHRRLRIFPLIRKAESRYLPFLLRRTLTDNGEWGVVRVRAVPNTYQSSELLIKGAIEQSNGETLILNIQAVDGAGRVWLDKTYKDTATEADYENLAIDPFQDIFNQIASDLLAMRSALSQTQLQHIAELATLLYGAELSQESFDEYLQRDEAGIYQLRRLPAKNDPMLKRIKRIREYEYLFIDTENEQYLSLFDNMKRTYDLWRQYSRELTMYIRDQATDAPDNRHQFRRGSYASMTDVYGNYASFRRQEQYMEELANGFNNEVLPTVMQLEDSVVKLSGSLESKYAQWQSILQSLFELERGATPLSP